MAAGTSPEQFEATLDATQTASGSHRKDATGEVDGDWLLQLFAQAEPSGNSDSPRPRSTDSIHKGLSLFGSDQLSGDYAFAKTALQQLSQPNPIAQFSSEDASQTITLTAPLDLQERLRVALPLEVRDGNHRYALCAHK